MVTLWYGAPDTIDLGARESRRSASCCDGGVTMDTRTCHRWVVSEAELKGLDALRARDLLVECFMAAQRETFVQAKGDLGLPIDEEGLRRSVVSAVRGAFKSAGGDYSAPTRQSLEGAIEVLAASASAWGTPREIIRHHHAQIERVIARVPA